MRSTKPSLLSLDIILPSSIKIGRELFEINRNKHSQTDTQTDTYTPMKIIPVQKQSFLGQVKSIPVYKKGERNNANNNRGIAIISCVAKR